MRSRASGWAGTYRTLLPLPKKRGWGTPWRFWRSRTRRPQNSSHRRPWCRNVARIARSHLPLSVSAGGASSSARAWPSRERRRLAFVVVGFRALDPADRVVADRVNFAEVVEQRSDRGQLTPDGTGGQAAAL